MVKSVLRITIAVFAIAALAAPGAANQTGSAHRSDRDVITALRNHAGKQRNRRHATVLPTWNGSFTAAGRTIPYTMVGTNPALGSATTRVPVRIAPLRLTFS